MTANDIIAQAIDLLTRTVNLAEEKHKQLVNFSQENALLKLNISTLTDMVADEQIHYVTMREHYEAEISKLKAENDKLGDLVTELIIDDLGCDNTNEK